MERRKGMVYIYLLITFMLWGSIYVASKYAMGSLPVLAVTGLRFLVAVIPLLAVGLRRLRETPIDKGDWKYLILLGAMGYFLTPVLNMTGLNMISASTASLVNSLNPVGITIMAALVLKERIGPRHILCLLLAVAGTVVITGGGKGGGGQAIGVLCVLASVATWGFCSVTMRRINRKYGSLVVTTYGILISEALYIPLIFRSLSGQGAARFEMGAVLAIVYLGTFGTALAQYLWGKSLSMMEASKCSVFYPLQAVFSSLLAAMLLNERFTPEFFIGAALIAAGVVINCTGGHSRAAAPGTAHGDMDSEEKG